jgi:opacity protein-like surface antigen
MKRLAIVLASLCAFAAPASAQVFGQLHPAHPIRHSDNLWGAYLMLGDRVDDIGLLGQVRFSASSTFDWGLQFGFADGPGDGAVVLGGDIRPSIKRADDEFPLDLAFDGAVGLTIGDNFTLLELQPAFLYGHRFPLDSGGAISPYGSVGIDVQNVSFDDVPPGFDDSDTETDVIARFGMEWEASRTFGIIGEFGVGNGTTFVTGINVLF